MRDIACMTASYKEEVEKSFRDYALEQAAQGFRVFPLMQGGKNPALATDWRKLASIDSDRVYAMWTDPVTGWALPFNIGIATGSGLVVLDIDVKNGRNGKLALSALELDNERLPPTRTVRTPSGGEHRYFRTDRPIGNSASAIADGIDVRGEGGFVVGAGSVVAGGRYERVR